MMKSKMIFAAPALALGLLASASHAQYGQQQSFQQYDHDHDQDRWDAPPQDFNDMNRRAYHDGIDAAQMQAQNHQPMNFARTANYRRPPVDRSMRDQYRQSFVRGYQAAQQRYQAMQQSQQQDWHHDHDHYNDNYPYNQPH